jgi:hypothetical protein
MSEKRNVRVLARMEQFMDILHFSPAPGRHSSNGRSLRNCAAEV